MILSDVDVIGYDTVLLDRDGTINRQIVGDYVKCWSEFEFIPGAIDAIVRFSKTAKYIFIVTNQRGIGRGLMTDLDLSTIHDKMKEEIVKAGGKIDNIYYASGIDEKDPCRKPNTGLWERIKREYPDVTERTTVMIGDGDCDKEFAENCGVNYIRVNSPL